jgi:cytochrome bd ubiquinol oxidase subunit II
MDGGMKGVKMEFLHQNIQVVWYVIIGFLLMYYVITDGWDLGIGIISLVCPRDEERGLMMDVISGTWHNSQTWLVLLGGMLFGAFPLFYSIFLSSLYLPMILMLVGFIFRGISFEFRENSTQKALWSRSFGLGSLIIALAQGFALGGVFGGLEIKNGQFAGTVWDWLSPYPALMAVTVVSGYVMLGTSYLILKTEGTLQNRAYRLAGTAGVLTLFSAIAISFWTITRYPAMLGKWSRWPDVFFLIVFPALAALSAAVFFRSLRRKEEAAPLLGSALVVLFGFIGISTLYFPYLIPERITIREAASSADTLFFMLIVAAVFIPLILIYTLYNRTVFQGKVKQGY